MDKGIMMDLMERIATGVQECRGITSPHHHLAGNRVTEKGLGIQEIRRMQRVRDLVIPIQEMLSFPCLQCRCHLEVCYQFRFQKGKIHQLLKLRDSRNCLENLAGMKMREDLEGDTWVGVDRSGEGVEGLL